MVRSPTVFEDVVKTICTTNTSWGGTTRMVNALVEHLGFRRVATLRDAVAEGIDMLIYEMRREECRFLKETK